MLARDIAGVLTAMIVLAGVSVAALRGSGTAQMEKGFADGFAEMTKAATATG